MAKKASELGNILTEEFGLGPKEVSALLGYLNDVIEEEDSWDLDFIGGPDDDRLPKTEFDLGTGLPIVHSRKIKNYTVNLRRIYKNAELHETAFDLFEDAISVHRLLYRIMKFLITESKITLGDVESAIYYLLWVKEITPVTTSKGYDLIAENLNTYFGSRVNQKVYQSCLDKLYEQGLIDIQNDIVTIIEHPKTSSKNFKASF